MFWSEKQYDTISIKDAEERLKKETGILLLDVRTPQEYRDGHIPGSINLPLSEVQNIEKIAPKMDIPMFVYCYSGARSGQACRYFARVGYGAVTNIGGIASWTGKVEMGKGK
ncbi:MAG: rhodanese-like domain-containing protein [Oscillospiraceae bacterium]